MDPAKYECQSELAKRCLAEGTEKGIEKGIEKGQAELVLKLLTLRFGPSTEDTIARVRAVHSAELEHFAERVLNATSLDETLFCVPTHGPQPARVARKVIFF